MLSRRTVSNVAGNWLGLGTNMAVGFLLTPFILHRLGNLAFGLWVLLTTFNGYYGMLDLGIRNAVIRYVARYEATEEMDILHKALPLCVQAGIQISQALAPESGIEPVDSFWLRPPDEIAAAPALLERLGRLLARCPSNTVRHGDFALENRAAGPAYFEAVFFGKGCWQDAFRGAIEEACRALSISPRDTDALLVHFLLLRFHQLKARHSPLAQDHTAFLKAALRQARLPFDA